MPLRSNRTHFLNSPAAALVLIVDPERAVHLPPAVLQELYDLTSVLMLRRSGTAQPVALAS
jgi:hypothetical protein